MFAQVLWPESSSCLLDSSWFSDTELILVDSSPVALRSWYCFGIFPLGILPHASWTKLLTLLLFPVSGVVGSSSWSCCLILGWFFLLSVHTVTGICHSYHLSNLALHKIVRVFPKKEKLVAWSAAEDSFRLPRHLKDCLPFRNGLPQKEAAEILLQNSI